MTVTISRIYLVDDIETNVAATSDDPQGALRIVERAAEAIGAAPKAVNSTPAPRNRGGRPKATNGEVTAKPVEPSPPPLPPGVQAAFPSNQQPLPFPPGGQSPVPMGQPGARPPFSPPAQTQQQPQVALAPDPPVALGQSSVGLAPPSGPPPFAPPPTFAPPPPPPQDMRAALRSEIAKVGGDMIAAIQAHKPEWLDSVAQTLTTIVQQLGGDVRTMSEDNLKVALVQHQQYAAQVRAALGG